MNKKITVGIGIISALLVLSSFYAVELSTDQSVTSDQSLAPTKPTKKNKFRLASKSGNATSERKQSVKGMARADRPDLFAQYHRDIRTRDGEFAPSYEYNYQIRELLKAKNITSTKSLKKASKISSVTWTERGPGNVSGRTRAIIVDPDDSTFDTWYAGSVGGGVWETTNAGGAWTEITSDLPNFAIGWLAMAASNHDVMYAGTGEGFISVDQINGSGIWKTEDRGATWAQLTSTGNLEFQNITRIVVDPADENIVLVTTSVGVDRAPTTSGIHRTTDGGTTWTKVHDSGGNQMDQIIVNPDDFNIQYASVNGTGILKSTDAGVTWADASEGLGNFARMEMAIAPSNPSKLYISTPGGSNGSILYTTEDAGANWVQGADPDNSQDWLGGQGWYDNTIAVNPYDADEVFVGGINLWKLTMGDGIDTTAYHVLGVDEEGTTDFLTYVNFGGELVGGGIEIGPADDADRTTIEIRFGPGVSQKAHRFTVPVGATSGVADADYTYIDYVDVPFELWDTDNDVQLMISFRDQLGDGGFELEEYDDTNPPREYVHFSAEPYDATTPSPLMTVNGGQQHRQLYFMWPVLVQGATFPPTSGASTLRIKWGRSIAKTMATENITDGYGQFGGTRKGVHVDHHNIVLVPTDEGTSSFRMLNGNDGGVSFSDDAGETFLQPLNGYNTTQFYGVDKMNGADEYIGGMQDNSTWKSPAGEDANAASAWEPLIGGDGFESIWHYSDSTKLMGGSQYNGIARSLDGGDSWFFATTNMSDNGAGAAPFFTKLAKSKQDPELVFAVGASGVWRTDNFATSWELTEMPTGWVGNSSYSNVKISLVNPQVVWAGSSMRDDSPLFVSTDGGLTFGATNVYSDVTLGRISGIETHPTDDSTAYALFSFANAPKVLRTTDLGQTWEELSGFGTGITSANGFPDVTVYSLLVMPYDTDIIWVGTDIGLFESTDGGANWADANNGMPPAAIYEMVIVNDQVVIATHGRGIWSGTLTELAGYEPPTAILSPRFKSVAGGGAGLITADLVLASAYDSSFVTVDGEKLFSFTANAEPLDTVIMFSKPSETAVEVSVSVVSYKAGISFASSTSRVTVFPLLAAQESYDTDFTGTSADFLLNGFAIGRSDDFSCCAMHSPHPYLDAGAGSSVDLTTILKVPIVVTSQSAKIRYEDIALIEPGDAGSGFGDFEFWDYVIVEGSNDNGATWVPLADGYDAREQTKWLDAYEAGTDGDPSLFASHTFGFEGKFEEGDVVIIRFRLNADTNVNGWGWVIDNLSIVPGVLDVDEGTQLPSQFNLSQNYPNPFNPSTTIRYEVPISTSASLIIYDLAGREVVKLLDGEIEAGYHQTNWAGRGSSGRLVASGLYVARLVTPTYSKSIKMVLLK